MIFSACLLRIFIAIFTRLLKYPRIDTLPIRNELGCFFVGSSSLLKVSDIEKGIRTIQKMLHLTLIVSGGKKFFK